MSSGMPLPRPVVVPPSPWEFPEPDELDLANGVRVLAYDMPGQYVLSVRVAVPMPVSREPFLLEGVGTIMARCLDEGTARHDSREIAELLERRGVSLDAGVGEAGLTVSMEVAKPHLDYGLDMMRECLLEASFPEFEVDRHVRTRLQDIEQERANPSSRAAVEFIKTYFDSTQRASRPTAGSVDTVSAITAEEVRRYHSLEVGPLGTTVTIAGDFAGIDPGRAVAAALGEWTGGRQPAPDLRGVAAQRADDAERVVFVDRPGSVQTEFYVGCPGPDRAVEGPGGWAAYPAAAFAMGGAPTSRVDAVLREEKGYTYGIRSSFRPRRRGGLFLTSGSVRADVTAAALGELVEILDSGRAGFTVAEVSGAADFLSLTAPGRYATADVVADEAAAFALEGLTTRFTTALLRDLPWLTPEVVTEAYRRFVDGRWTIVVVGDAAAHAAAVESLGVGAVTVVSA